MAEGVGFEPTDAYKTSTVFKTGAIGHSAIPPDTKDIINYLLSFCHILIIRHGSHKHLSFSVILFSYAVR